MIHVRSNTFLNGKEVFLGISKLLNLAYFLSYSKLSQSKVSLTKEFTIEMSVTSLTTKQYITKKKSGIGTRTEDKERNR